MADRTEPDAETEAEERGEALAAHQADRGPSSDEEAAAERGAARPDRADPEEVAEHYQEMSELGAEAKGEGRIP